MKKSKYNQLVKFLRSVLEQNRFIRESKVRALNQQKIKLVCEICLNIIRSNIKLPNEFIHRLKKYRSQLGNLTSEKKSLVAKKRILLTQRGGNLLSIIIPAVLNYFLK